MMGPAARAGRGKELAVITTAGVGTGKSALHVSPRGHLGILPKNHSMPDTVRTMLETQAAGTHLVMADK